MRTTLRIQAVLGHPQPLHGTPANQVFFNNYGGVLGAYVSIPDSLGVDHHHWSVFTLVKATGFVDPHASAKTGLLRQLLEPCMQIALSIRRARAARRIRGARIVANKDVAFESWQA
jgi:hypothetical protein